MDTAKLNYEVDQLVKQPIPTDSEAVDLAGELAHIISKLSTYKRALLSEVPGPVDGEKYRTVVSRSARRSYNTAAILSAFDNDLRSLISADAVRLQWRWTQLKDEARKRDVTLVVAHHEIEDEGEVDGPMIGEVWSDQVKVEGK